MNRHGASCSQLIINNQRQVVQCPLRIGLNIVFGTLAFLLKNRRGFDSEAFWHFPLTQTGVAAACSPAIATDTMNNPSTALYIFTSPRTRARHHVEDSLSTNFKYITIGDSFLSQHQEALRKAFFL
jgi:hypothetical protein